MLGGNFGETLFGVQTAEKEAERLLLHAKGMCSTIERETNLKIEELKNETPTLGEAGLLQGTPALNKETEIFEIKKEKLDKAVDLATKEFLRRYAI